MQSIRQGIRRKLFVFGGLSVFLLAAALSLASCGDRAGSVEGTATKAADGQPLAQAEVSAFSLSEVEDAGSIDVFTRVVAAQNTTTDASGAFSLTLDPGRYEIQAQTEGYEPANSLVEVKAGRTVRIDLSLDAATP